MPEPVELLDQALAKLRSANRIDGNRNSYRKDSPNEYAAVMSYLAGGTRPPAVVSDMGVGLMLAEDARRGLVVVEPEPPPTGTILFDGDFDVATLLDQWTSVATPSGNATASSPHYNSVAVVGAQNGVSPRHGSKMLLTECRVGNRTSWNPTTQQGSFTQKNPTIPGGVVNGLDLYTGFSMYVFPGITLDTSTNMNTNLFEWHSVAGLGEQAPIHFGITDSSTPAGDWFIDLHREIPYNPMVFFDRLGPATPDIGTWKNVVIRTKWSSTNTGAVQLWMKNSDSGAMQASDLKSSHLNIATWNTYGGNSLYAQVGFYRGIPNPETLGRCYFDSFKVGTTLAAVDPASYD